MKKARRCLVFLVLVGCTPFGIEPHDELLTITLAENLFIEEPYSGSIEDNSVTYLAYHPRSGELLGRATVALGETAVISPPSGYHRAHFDLVVVFKQLSGSQQFLEIREYREFPRKQMLVMAPESTRPVAGIDAREIILEGVNQEDNEMFSHYLSLGSSESNGFFLSSLNRIVFQAKNRPSKFGEGNEFWMFMRRPNEGLGFEYKWVEIPEDETGTVGVFNQNWVSAQEARVVENQPDYELLPTLSMYGFLDRVDRLPFQYRIPTRVINDDQLYFPDIQQAGFDRYRKEYIFYQPVASGDILDAVLMQEESESLQAEVSVFDRLVYSADGDNWPSFVMSWFGESTPTMIHTRYQIDNHGMENTIVHWSIYSPGDEEQLVEEKVIPGDIFEVPTGDLFQAEWFPDYTEALDMDQAKRYVDWSIELVPPSVPELSGGYRLFRHQFVR